MVIEEIEEKHEAPAVKKETKEKKRAAAEPAAAAPPAKKEKAAPAPVKKEKETPKKAAPAAEEPAKGQLKREFKNGMEIVNIAMGKPGGKQAKPEEDPDEVRGQAPERQDLRPDEGQLHLHVPPRHW